MYPNYVISTMNDYRALSEDDKRDFRKNEVKKQNGKCLLCDKPFDERPTSLPSVVDHDHSTERIRGILHQQCNTDLSVIERHLDDDFIDKAKEYISKNKP